MNTCDTCKHWFWSKGYEHRGNNTILKPCQWIEDSHNATHNDPTAAAVANGIDSYVITGPKFGCIHWEAK